MPEIRNVAELSSCAVDAIRSFNNETLWWRGQASSAWSLIPRIHRQPRKDIEFNIASRFVQRAKTRHANCPADNDLPGWLSLMQHYRLPTRLLDWSESPLIALFFAVYEDAEGPAALWALSPTRLNLATIGQAVIVGNAKPEARELFGAALSGEVIDRALAFQTYEVDLRMLVQLSAQTIHGSPKSLNDLSDNNKFLVKFEIPASAKLGLKQELAILGVRLSNIFPDLEHLSQELSQLELAVPSLPLADVPKTT